MPQEMGKPFGEMDGFFMKLRLYLLIKDLKMMENGMKLCFFLERWSPLVGTRVGGCELMKDVFLNYTTKDGRDFIINRTPCITRAADKWQGYLPGDYRLFLLQVWDPLRASKEAAFRGLFDTKWWWSMDEGQKLPRYQFLSNVSFVCPRQSNRSSINFTIVSKSGEFDNGLHSLCMSFVK